MQCDSVLGTWRRNGGRIITTPQDRGEDVVCSLPNRRLAHGGLAVSGRPRLPLPSGWVCLRALPAEVTGLSPSVARHRCCGVSEDTPLISPSRPCPFTPVLQLSMLFPVDKGATGPREPLAAVEPAPTTALGPAGGCPRH